jgi:hypothetical protein
MTGCLPCGQLAESVDLKYSSMHEQNGPALAGPFLSHENSSLNYLLMARPGPLPRQPDQNQWRPPPSLW